MTESKIDNSISEIKGNLETADHLIQKHKRMKLNDQEEKIKSLSKGRQKNKTKKQTKHSLA